MSESGENDKEPPGMAWFAYGGEGAPDGPRPVSWAAKGAEWTYLVLRTPDGTLLTRWGHGTPAGDARTHQCLANSVRTAPGGSPGELAHARLCALAWEEGLDGGPALAASIAWRREGRALPQDAGPPAARSFSHDHRHWHASPGEDHGHPHIHVGGSESHVHPHIHVEGSESHHYPREDRP